MSAVDKLAQSTAAAAVECFTRDLPLPGASFSDRRKTIDAALGRAVAIYTTGLRDDAETVFVLHALHTAKEQADEELSTDLVAHAQARKARAS